MRVCRFSISAGYLNLHNPLDAALGGTNGYIGDFACSNPSALYCQLQNAEALKAYGAGASYAIGPATIALTYTHTRCLSIASTSPTAPIRKAATSRSISAK